MRITTVLALSLFGSIFIGQAAPPDSATGASGEPSGTGPLLDSARRQKEPPPANGPARSIRVNTDLTLVPVTVTDAFGRNVRGLEKQNFRVFENAEQRSIVAFGREDAPISIGLIFDSSGSMKDKFKMARDAASQLLNQLSPEDEAFLVTVSTLAQLRQDFTSDPAEISDALVFTNSDGSTSLLDGVNLGLEHLKKSHTPRKALVVVSDGGENNSRYTLHELLARAVEADTLIYTICLFQDPQSTEELGGPDLLADLAQKTGGMAFFLKDRETNNLGQVMGTIGVTLHNQYVLGYYPPEKGPAGKYRKIKVQLLLPKGMPEMHIYTRTGYYAPER